MISRILKALPALLIGCALPSWGYAATLLPQGVQTFTDNNGQPLSGGIISFYIPGTTTPKSTYQNSAGTILNTNPVILDSSGRAIIYGSGAYQETVQDANGNLIWSQITTDTSATGYSWAGTSGGTANVQTLSAPSFAQTDGQIIGFIAGHSNTGALTFTVNGGSPINVVKATTSGPVALTGGEVIAGNQYQVTYSASNGNLQLSTTVTNAAFVSLASASTTDLGSTGSSNVTITGSATISSFGSSANLSAPVYNVVFTGAAILTYNATSLILPTSASITTAAGDSLVAQYLGSGNWQVISYTRANGQPIVLPPATLAPWAITGGLPSSMTGTSTTAAITVTALTAVDQTDAAPIFWAGTKSWAVSNGNAINGYAGGTTLPNSSTIHMYACSGASGSGPYASTTAPGTFVAANCPAGYTNYARRIFSFNTNGSGAPLAFNADETTGGGFTAFLATAPTDMSAVTLATSRTLYALSVPSGIKLEWQGSIINSAASSAVWVSSPDDSDVAPVLNTVTDATTNSQAVAFQTRRLITNTASQLYFRGAGSAVVTTLTTGFTDPRRS